jgi:hypothetical protein
MGMIASSVRVLAATLRLRSSERCRGRIGAVGLDDERAAW